MQAHTLTQVTLHAGEPVEARCPSTSSGHITRGGTTRAGWVVAETTNTP